MNLAENKIEEPNTEELNPEELIIKKIINGEVKEEKHTPIETEEIYTTKDAKDKKVESQSYFVHLLEFKGSFVVSQGFFKVDKDYKPLEQRGFHANFFARNYQEAEQKFTEIATEINN